MHADTRSLQTASALQVSSGGIGSEPIVAGQQDFACISDSNDVSTWSSNAKNIKINDNSMIFNGDIRQHLAPA
jgi:hypothetical protein